MHLSFSLLCSIIVLLPVNSIGTTRPLKLNQNSTILIIGSSVPAVLVGWVLSSYNISITMVYSTPNVENRISNIVSIVNNETYSLPKMQPVIFENSKKSLKMVNSLGRKLQIVNGFSIYFQNNQFLPLSSNESISDIISKLISVGCISSSDVNQLSNFVNALQNYNYSIFRSKYSGLTLAQFGKLMNVPDSFIKCAMNLLTIESGMNIDNFNAADAIARIVFYFLQSMMTFSSYYINYDTSTSTQSSGIIEQIVDKMKLLNVEFIANTKVELLNVNDGIIDGIFGYKKKFDLVILGDSLISSRNILINTIEANHNDAIYFPLLKILKQLNKYSPGPNLASVKIWLNTFVESSKSVVEVNNSPYPCSIQSIKQLTKLSITHWNTVLEIVVAMGNDGQKMNLDKIHKELFEIFTGLTLGNIINEKIDWIDDGVLMDTNYGLNRLTTDSVQKAGIPNLILAADWLDAENSIACDLERSIEIAIMAAKNTTLV